MEKNEQIIKTKETYSLVLGKRKKINVNVRYFTDKGVVCRLDNDKLKTISDKIFEANGYYRKKAFIEKINGEDLEILFQIDDSKDVILGNDLDVPKMGYCGDYEIDWSIESMLVSIELAMDEGIVINTKYGTSFNCKINGQYYHVINDKEAIFIITKININ